MTPVKETKAQAARRARQTVTDALKATRNELARQGNVDAHSMLLDAMLYEELRNSDGYMVLEHLVGRVGILEQRKAEEERNDDEK
jgi:hypothetical protein